MSAFWGAFLLAAYGCLGGLVQVLNRWFGALFGDAAVAPWVQPFPLLGSFGWAQLVAVVLLAIVAIVMIRYLNRPKLADLLIETENELKKVTWPSAHETMAGTIAVAVTVVVLFLFLTGADTALVKLMDLLLKNRGG